MMYSQQYLKGGIRLEKVHISDAQLSELIVKINEHKEKPGPLMPTLHDAQKILGFIPFEIQELISKELDVPVAKINGVVSFYAQFSATPKGKHIVGICMGTACYVKGAQAILDKVKLDLQIDSGETSDDGEFTLEATRCIGACALAPVMSVNEEIYGKLNDKTAIKSLDNHRDRGEANA